MGQMRPLITGGCSYCSASDENVGKRRCKHTLGQPSIQKKGDALKIVKKPNVSIKTIKAYFKKNKLPAKKQKAILKKIK